MEELASWGDHMEEDTGAANSVGVLDDAILTRPPVKEGESFQDQIKGFATAWAELAMELSRSCWDVARQTIIAEDSYFLCKVRQPLAKISEKLSFFNEFLPEDRDPFRAWLVIFIVSLLAFTVMNVASKRETSEMKTALQAPIEEPELVLLPDGRYMGYHEHGVDARNARFTLIFPHAFFCPQSSGVFGINSTLLETFGVRLISYHLLSWAQSRSLAMKIDLNSSAHDMLYLADFVRVKGKFWVLGYSTGALHAWAALKYIPHKVSGAVMLAPFINPCDKGMTKEEKSRIWSRWSWRRRLLFFLVGKFPKLLTSRGWKLKRSSSSFPKKDKDLIETRSTCQNILQWDDEAVLQACKTGFNLADIKPQKKCPRRYTLLPFLYARPDCKLTGFTGPVHIWQGMDDIVVSPVVSDYVERILPGASIHRLPGEGHFSYYFFCEECHKKIFKTIFGSPNGPVITADKDQLSSVDEDDHVVPV